MSSALLFTGSIALYCGRPLASCAGDLNRHGSSDLAINIFSSDAAKSTRASYVVGTFIMRCYVLPAIWLLRSNTLTKKRDDVSDTNRLLKKGLPLRPMRGVRDLGLTLVADKRAATPASARRIIMGSRSINCSTEPIQVVSAGDMYSVGGPDPIMSQALTGFVPVSDSCEVHPSGPENGAMGSQIDATNSPRPTSNASSRGRHAGSPPVYYSKP